jgi:chemotaxis protein CheC
MPNSSSIDISEYQYDVLRELINIGVGNAAGVLNQMVNSHVTLQVPEILVLSPADLASQPSTCDWGKGVAINIAFGGAFEGVTALVFSPQSASNLVSLLVGQEDFCLDMDSLRIGTLQEVGNIVLNGVMGSIANMLSEHIDYMPPDYFEDDIIKVLPTGDGEDRIIIFIRANFLITEHLVEGEVFIFFNSTTLQALLEKIDAKLGLI